MFQFKNSKVFTEIRQKKNNSKSYQRLLKKKFKISKFFDTFLAI